MVVSDTFFAQNLMTYHEEVLLIKKQLELVMSNVPITFLWWANVSGFLQFQEKRGKKKVSLCCFYVKRIIFFFLLGVRNKAKHVLNSTLHSLFATTSRRDLNMPKPNCNLKWWSNPIPKAGWLVYLQHWVNNFGCVVVVIKWNLWFWFWYQRGWVVVS
jgi:hypothetical protein